MRPIKARPRLFAGAVLGALAAMALATGAAAQGQGGAGQPPAAAAARDPAFDRLDANGDGVIVFEEFVRASDARLKPMDRDGDGRITREEFLSFHAGEAERAFRRLDRNRNGVLTPAEWRVSAAAFKRVDANGDGRIAHAEWMAFRRAQAQRWQERIFRTFDANRDGVITREEFARARARWQASRAGRPRDLFDDD